LCEKTVGIPQPNCRGKRAALWIPKKVILDTEFPTSLRGRPEHHCDDRDVAVPPLPCLLR